MPSDLSLSVEMLGSNAAAASGFMVNPMRNAVAKTPPRHHTEPVGSDAKKTASKAGSKYRADFAPVDATHASGTPLPATSRLSSGFEDRPQQTKSQLSSGNPSQSIYKEQQSLVAFAPLAIRSPAMIRGLSMHAGSSPVEAKPGPSLDTAFSTASAISATSLTLPVSEGTTEVSSSSFLSSSDSKELAVSKKEEPLPKERAPPTEAAREFQEFEEDDPADDIDI